MAANATALRLLLERLVDELDELERIVWTEPDVVRDLEGSLPVSAREPVGPTTGPTLYDDLRRRIGDSMMYATSALDLAET